MLSGMPEVTALIPIEVQSALSRLYREGYLNDKGYQAAIGRFSSIENNKLEVLTPGTCQRDFATLRLARR
jgi:hypothetical protein